MINVGKCSALQALLVKAERDYRVAVKNIASYAEEIGQNEASENIKAEAKTVRRVMKDLHEAIQGCYTTAGGDIVALGGGGDKDDGGP